MIGLNSETSYFRYVASEKNESEKDGEVKMHRRVTSEDVEDYSSHIPRDVVALDQEEDIVYRKGVLTHSEGVSTVKMMPQVNNATLGMFCCISPYSIG